MYVGGNRYRPPGNYVGLSTQKAYVGYIHDRDV